ncbi:hypothetical protein VTP01DRAFT_5055 [Rhizomucor pusillus]|uniref:uncharacterized protein n=1 Tax=Rhizomucor pusillus TaxID=4840 RepID=UPI003742CEFC
MPTTPMQKVVLEYTPSQVGRLQREVVGFLICRSPCIVILSLSASPLAVVLARQDVRPQFHCMLKLIRRILCSFLLHIRQNFLCLQMAMLASVEIVAQGDEL